MKWSFGAGLLVSVVLLSGCCLFMEKPPKVEQSAHVSLKYSTGVLIDDVWVHQEGQQLVIDGALHPRSFMEKEAGHVDITIKDADGNLLKQISVAPESTVFEKETGRVSAFSVSIDLVVSPEARVMLEAHPGTADVCSGL
ncbi:MAG: hypothetical protein JXR25_14030 [Pontiellaceae bacterium]|nr:hypothetical protein [Pontiellaceae bacterium]MBN2785937.1 hypothetical protein [Pontiellaceae bacterium]